MKVIDNGIERDMTPEEENIEKRIMEEDAKLFIPAPEADPFDELLDELENISSIKDIKAIAKSIKEKRGK